MNKKSRYIKDNGELNIEKLVYEYKNYIMTILHKSSQNLLEEDLEEICSDVFITIWCNRGKLDLEKDFSPYIASITHNLLKKKYRDIKILEDIEEYQNLADISNIEIIVSNIEENNILIEELNKLKNSDVDIFKRFYFYNEPIRYICNSLNISESKVKVSLYRTRIKLKKILKKRGF